MQQRERLPRVVLRRVQPELHIGRGCNANCEEVIIYLPQAERLLIQAWMKHGVLFEEPYGMLSKREVSKLKTFDLPLLVKHVNSGKPLPKRQDQEEPLPVMRFNCEPLRYRHKPLIFYGITHGANFALHLILKKHNFAYVSAADPKKDIGYWYRLPSDNDCNNKSNISKEPPLVFAHGVGGLGFCYQMIKDLLENDTIRDQTPLILLDLPHVSLRLYDHIPKIIPQVESISKIIDDVVSYRGDDRGQSKATFVGHSYGTYLLSWMVQKYPEKVGGCVFLDPVCFNLHLKHILFNFHMQRVDKRRQAGKKWSSPFDFGTLKDMAGTEMHTNNSMLRQFSWTVNSLWPEDLKENNIPATIILTEKDDIVPARAVEELFIEFNAKNGKTDQTAPLVKVYKDANHGEMFMDESLRKDAAGLIIDLMEKNRKNSPMFTDPISLIKKEYQELNDTVGEVWDQISYILPMATKRTNVSSCHSMPIKKLSLIHI